MLKSIQIMLALTAHFDYELWQIDVWTTFLHEELDEEVYMIQLEEFTYTDKSKVYKLLRFIYGLKQASQSWNLWFDRCIKSYSFIRNSEESCIYKWVNGSVIVFLILYVNDILLIRNDVLALQGIKV